jgi:hypothetical protein
MDAKDILGLPKTAFPSVQEKKPRAPKEPQRKPDGVSREVRRGLIRHPPAHFDPAFLVAAEVLMVVDDPGVRAHWRGGDGSTHADHRGFAPEAATSC